MNFNTSINLQKNTMTKTTHLTSYVKSKTACLMVVLIGALPMSWVLSVETVRNYFGGHNFKDERVVG